MTIVLGAGGKTLGRPCLERESREREVEGSGGSNIIEVEVAHVNQYRKGRRSWSGSGG